MLLQIGAQANHVRKLQTSGLPVKGFCRRFASLDDRTNIVGSFYEIERERKHLQKEKQSIVYRVSEH